MFAFILSIAVEVGSGQTRDPVELRRCLRSSARLQGLNAAGFCSGLFFSGGQHAVRKALLRLRLDSRVWSFPVEKFRAENFKGSF